MKYINFLLIPFLVFTSGYAQEITVSEQFDLPNTVLETSGLLYFNNRLITHNDSGTAAELYEIDETNGSIVRTVTVTNATNVDWEDIAQDDTYIYVGDIGNNGGDRTNLRIYRILKTDYESSTSVTADIIDYSYADQTDFTTNVNNNDWDAEGFVIYGTHILIFSKNWVNNEVDVYAMPKTTGTHSAAKVSSYNVQGLVTGADNAGSDKIYLSGYSESNVTPFVLMIYDIIISPPSNLDLFASSSVFKFDSILLLGNQTEGICYVETNGLNDTLYLSNEELTVSMFTFPSKLRELTVDNTTLSVGVDEAITVDVFPIPFNDCIKINTIADKVTLYDALGKEVIESYNTDTIDTHKLPNGFYHISIRIDGIIINKKIVK